MSNEFTSEDIPQHPIQPGEAYAIGFDYAGKLPTGAGIASATVTALDASDGSNEDGILDSTTATVSGTKVTAGLDGSQTDGVNYNIIFTVTLDNASADVLIDEILVKCNDLT